MFEQPQQSQKQSEKAPLKIMQCENKDIAISYICKLAMFDSRYASMPFSVILNEIYACVNHNQYSVIAMTYDAPDGKQHDTPVGYVLWGKFNHMTLAVYAKNIRVISPGEYKSGDDEWCVQFCSPFGYQQELLEFAQKTMPNLMNNEKLKSLDLFEKIGYN